MSMTLRAPADTRIEVHKFLPGAVPGAAFCAVLLQASLPLYVSNASLLALPMLVTLYFGLSRRNPSSGLLLGMAIGLLQDGVSGLPFGLYGIANTLVGFLASSIGSRLDVEHPFSRFLFAFGFYYFHLLFYVLTSRWVLARDEAFFGFDILWASLINALIALPLFLLLDRFRRSS